MNENTIKKKEQDLKKIKQSLFQKNAPPPSPAGYVYRKIGRHLTSTESET